MKRVPDTRIWICDTHNKVHFEFKTTMTLKEFIKKFTNDPFQTRNYILDHFNESGNIPHSGEWLLRLVIMPTSFVGVAIQKNVSISDERIEYIGISAIYLSA